MKNSLLIKLSSLVLGVGLSFSQSAKALTIDGGAVAPSPISLGNGLDGAFWKADASVLNIRNISEANAAIAGRSPDWSFVSTRIDYPNDNTPGARPVDNGVPDIDLLNNAAGLKTYLGVDAAIDTPDTDLTRSVFKSSGFINILRDFDKDMSTAEIDIDFSVSSDDGFQLIIGNKDFSFDGLRFGTTTQETVSFTTAGLYALELTHFSDRGFTGIESASSFSPLPRGIVPTEVLYTSVPPQPVPTPAPLLGLIGMGIATLRRSKQKSETNE